MIVNHDHRWVLVSPPKTASTSLHRWLAGPNYFNPRPRWQHCAEIPAECEGYTVWTVTRHPYDRAVSLWRHLCNEVRHNPPTFAQFAELLAKAAFKPFYQRLQVDWLAGVKVDRYLRFEELPGCLAAIEGLPDSPLPHANRTEHAPWQELIDDQIEAWLWEWARRDFEGLVYERPGAW